MSDPNDLDFEEMVLEFVQRPNYQPVKPRIIAEGLKLAPDLHGAIKKAVKRLTRAGKIKYGANHLVERAAGGTKHRTEREGVGAKSEKLFTGRFHRTNSGNGFVRPTGTHASQGRDADVYIPARHSLDAATGDQVLVRFHAGRRGPRGKSGSGEITQIIQRQTNQFVGTYYEESGVGLVRVDGKVFSYPVEVGDPGAKDAHIGDKVVFEMIRFPTHAHPGEGVLTEVLGKRGEPEVDTLLIVRQFGLSEAFAEDAVEQARQTAQAFEESIPSGRTDLTGSTTLTIDPTDARDFDDAISLKRLENGHWQLAVHIADVAHFVPPKTALDREARDRATSVYLPTRVLPMLPESISNHVASLQPHKVRYTLTAVMEMTAEGARVATDVCRAAIRSDQRLTYEEVDEFLADPDKFAGVWQTEVVRLLNDMHALAMILRNRRMERGSLELSLPEVKLDFDDQQRVNGAHRVENTVSHKIIEEFMLSANEAIAERLEDQGILFLRRVHESPDPRKLESLGKFVRELGIKTEELRGRDEIKRVLAEVEGQPAQYAINYAILRSMQKAVYSPVEEGHYALASRCYCHFTSPIRRYPDLTVHRLLHNLIDGKSPENHLDQLLILGEHCSEREQRAESAERDLIKLKLLQFLAQRIGQAMDAVITGVQEFGFFAQGLEFPAEGLVHVHSLAEDHYHYDPAAHTLSGYRSGNAFRLGDLVRVEIARVDIDGRELDLRFIKRLAQRPREPLSPTGPLSKLKKESARDSTKNLNHKLARKKSTKRPLKKKKRR
ncbi:MAG: ribonuclease R [Planctomycetota bacterium]|nr:ribonuclease R [Planctomycetota bacterium]